MSYAKDTSVSPARSRAEIEEQVERFGARAFLSGHQDGAAFVAFEARGRRVLFRMNLPDPADHARTATGKVRSAGDRRSAADKEERRRWRALALAIKAKLVAVTDEIETFESAFMAHIVMPDGLTVADHVAPRIADAYATGQMPPLLPGPKS